MLLTEARRPARTRPDGALIPLAEQDRALWNREHIREGVALITDTLARARLGSYQLQAAIAAVHDEAPRAQDTDWPQILALYGLLEQVTGNPVVTLNKAVAAGMADGPSAGLAVLEDVDEQFAGHHRVASVRAHLLELAGDREGAFEHYRAAAARATNLAEQRYLTKQAARLSSVPGEVAARGDL